MSYQAPAFYFYHAAREAVSVAVDTPDPSPEALFDGRQGEIYVYTRDFATAGNNNLFNIERPSGSPAADAVDHIIISSHNLNLSEVECFASPTVVDLLVPNYTVTEANGVPIFIPLTTVQPVAGGHEDVQISFRQGGAAGTVVPEMGEVFLTTKHEMSRGPDPGWDHPWLRAQRQFVNESGVASTWLKGAARKRFNLTWHALEGADRQILFDLQEQTNDWSEPFWFQPPDTIYPSLLMQLERDSDWTQDGLSPLDTGTTDRVTLPLIEVLG
ncbi:MAG: hypothetical protein V3S94_08970 [Gammaproteobacteria bacterium]